MRRTDIERRRSALGWTVSELSQRARVPESTLRKIETEGRTPRKYTALALERALSRGERKAEAVAL